MQGNAKRWKCRWRDLPDAAKMAVARTEMEKRSGDGFCFFFFFLSTYRPARCIAFYCNLAACQSPRSSKIPLSCCQNPDTRRYWLPVSWVFLDHCTSSRFCKKEKGKEDDFKKTMVASATPSLHLWQINKLAEAEDRF